MTTLKITGLPEKRLVLNPKTGKKAKGWAIPTSDGWLTVKDLAEREELGLSASIILERTKRLARGKITPEVFFAAPNAKLQPRPAARIENNVDPRLVPPEDYGKYAHLLDIPRDENLKWIPGYGRWEKSRLKKNAGRG